MTDLATTIEDHVAVLEIRRPPFNYFDLSLISQIGDALDACDADPGIRAVVLAAEGKCFCAGADFASQTETTPEAKREATRKLYKAALRLFGAKKPIVAAVHGAAIGGGLGLAMVADFRVTCPEARFSANFTRLGFHPGFGLTVTLPRILGQTSAELMLYTARRFTGEDAFRMGLASELVPQPEVRSAALRLAGEIAENSPLGTVATRATMRRGLADLVDAATDVELDQQTWLRETDDFAEGIKAAAERRIPVFSGR